MTIVAMELEIGLRREKKRKSTSSSFVRETREREDAMQLLAQA